MAPPRKGDLSQEERQLLEGIGQGNTEEAARLLGSKNVRVNCLDEHGMTPLMHAAYKGKVDVCKLLLRHGADVNCNEHEHGYTALMFAGLSGNKEITWMMLEAGAETDVVNSVGRTAAQMAAFVGQHDCVTVINNFFPRERLDYYTKPQGLDKEPKLPVKLAGPLHKIITTTNLHPVKIVLLVKENPLLAEIEAMQKCYKVLDLICEKCMKQRDMNEVLAMKMHYLSSILQKCIYFLKEREDKLDGLIKSLLKGRDKDGFPVYQEKLIRECIRKFPYCEATLLQQLVRSIAPVEIGCDPTAFSVLTQAITGQVGFMETEFCTTCGEKGAAKRCSVCKMVIYCDQNCQKLHWFTHKKVCKMLKEAHEKQELEAAKEKREQEKKQKKGGGMKLHSNHGRKVLFCWKLAFGLSFLFSVSASKAVCSSVCYLKLTLSWRKWAMSEEYNHCLPRKKLLYKKMAGVLVIPKGKGKDACRLGANFTIPPNTVDWIAFDVRGNCTFKEKIKAALGKGSSDVLIYAHSCLDRKCFIFLHGGAGDIAARMINSRKVKQILRLIQAGIRVTATTEMLTTPCFTATYLCECSLMLTFVFFVFVCYIARKMVGRQGEQPTKTELKNAIHSLESRKLKKGEFELAEETCVVCFEAYKVREVVRILTCKHIFHKRCIDPWLLKQGTCPLCNCSIIQN